jgi:molybdate transport system ATP-binding protein
VAFAARSERSVTGHPFIDIDVRLNRGNFCLDLSLTTQARAVALFGRSGSGKSTLIHLLAGLLRPQEGHVRIGDQSLVDIGQGVWVPPHRRRVGLVFQDALLFPHLSVQANLRFGAWFASRRQRSSLHVYERSDQRFAAIVAQLGLNALLGRKPSSLSGGERQRVAIGRALLADPAVLLMDEPLAALDTERKLEILPYILRLHRELDVPIVYVSHSPDEVARIAAEVVLIDAGKVTDQGPPGEVLAPAWSRAERSRFAAVSVIEARVREYDETYGLTVFEHPAGPISLPGRIGRPGDPHRFVVRATDVALAVQRPRDVSFRTVLFGRIAAIERDDGPIVRVDIRLPGDERIVALVTRKAVDELAIDAGDDVFAMVKATALDERALR